MWKECEEGVKAAVIDGFRGGGVKRTGCASARGKWGVELEGGQYGHCGLHYR